MASVIIAYFNIRLDHYESNGNFSRLRTQNLKWGFMTYHVGRCRQGLQFIYTFFSKTDTLCAELCNHAEGGCDEITGKCECDWSDRSVEWCLEGSYGCLIKGAMCDVLSHFSDLMYTIFKLTELSLK